MNLERRTPDRLHPRRLPHHRCIGRLISVVGRQAFPPTLFCLVSLRALGESETNGLPKLLPPDGSMPPTFWEQHGTAVLAAGIVLLALAAAVAWYILKPRPQPIVPPAIAARETLEKCRARPEDGKVLSDISQALRHYLGAALEFPPGELTTAECRRELEHSDRITPQLAGAISSFLRACDERKFSMIAPSTPLNAADRALEFVALTENEVRRQEACTTTK